jgi:hypothetical protein
MAFRRAFQLLLFAEAPSGHPAKGKQATLAAERSAKWRIAGAEDQVGSCLFLHPSLSSIDIRRNEVFEKNSCPQTEEGMFVILGELSPTYPTPLTCYRS